MSTVDVIGEIVVPGVAVAISVAPILAVVVVMTTANGKAKGAAFVVGWIVTMAVLTGVLTLVGSGWTVEDDAEPSTASGVVKLILGALFLVFAVQQWKSRPRDGEIAPVPKLLTTLDGMGLTKVVVIGVGLAVLNVKNLPIVIGVALTIASGDLSTTGSLTAAGVFSVISALGLAAPLITAIAMGPERGAAILGSMRQWLTQNNAVIMAVMFLLLGASFVGDGIEALG